jgi:cell division protein FtsB
VRFNLGAFAGGAANGYAQFERLKLQKEESQREADRHKVNMEEVDRAKRDRDQREAVARAKASQDESIGIPKETTAQAYAIPESSIQASPLPDAPAGTMEPPRPYSDQRFSDKQSMPPEAKEATSNGLLAMQDGSVPMQDIQLKMPPEPTTGKPVTKNDYEIDRLLAQYQASHKKALEIGRPDLALEYAQKGMPLREQVRQKSFDTARAQYEATGNFEPIRAAYNKYIENGINIDSIQTDESGKITMRTSTADGKTGKRNLTPEEFKGMLNFAQNPAAARAIEAQYQEKLDASRLKMIEEGAKHRYQKVAPGERLIDTNTGAAHTNTDVSPKVTTLKDGETAYMYGPNGVIGKFGGGAGQARPEPVQKLQSETNSTIFKAFGANDMAGLDPRTKPLVEKQIELADRLISGSWGTENFNTLGAGTVQAVQYNGRTYFLTGAAGALNAAGAASLTKTVAPATSSPPSFPKVSAQAQQERDGLRMELLQRELQDNQKLVSNPSTPAAQRTAAQDAIRSLTTEINGAQKKQASLGLPKVQGAGTQQVSGMIAR